MQLQGACFTVDLKTHPISADFGDFFSLFFKDYPCLLTVKQTESKTDLSALGDITNIIEFDSWTQMINTAN